MNLKQLNILLADDDKDDCIFFKEAVDELSISTHLTTVHDGEQLMNYLSENSENLPDVIFLDLNMPCKNGFECLAEISQNEKLKNIPVVIFSISYPPDMVDEPDMINVFFKIGTHHFIRKHSDPSQLKQTIQNSLTRAIEKSPLIREGKVYN